MSRRRIGIAAGIVQVVLFKQVILEVVQFRRKRCRNFVLPSLSEDIQECGGQIWPIRVEMRKATIVFGLMFGLASATCVAEEFFFMRDALKNPSPSELPYYVSMKGDCPISGEQMIVEIEGVMVRSRVKPLGHTEFLTAPLYLSVDLTCVKVDSENTAFMLSVRFGYMHGSVAVLYDMNFGKLGVGSAKFMHAALEDFTENAMTTYLKANFDL